MKQKEMFHHSIEYIQKKLHGILGEINQKDIHRIVESFFQANRIFVYGAGRSGLVARAFAIRLVHLGFQTFVIGETIGAPVKKDDLVFVVTGSGVTIPTVMTAEIANDIGARLIVVTGKPNSQIARFATISIVLAAECKDVERKQLAPLGTLFEASAWILLDAIIAELMQRKNETEASMRSRHATLQ
jgi:6-phospho-3-hexuloisomerase